MCCGCGETSPGPPVRTVVVVVVDVDAQDPLELARADDQDPVEAPAPDGANQALGVGVRLGRPYRRLDDHDRLTAEDLLQRTAELGVAIVDQKARRRGWLGERPREPARLLRDPACARIGGGAATYTLRLPCSMKKGRTTLPEGCQ